MTIHDDARAAGERVIDAELAKLRGLIDTGTTLLEQERSAHAVTRSALGVTQSELTVEKGAHALTKASLNDLSALVGTLRARVAELEAASAFRNLYDPISFKTVEEAAKFYAVPADAKLVVWRWADDVMLEQAFSEMVSNEILVLPERATPYLYDTSDGFRAAGVTHLMNGSQRIDVKNTYRGKTARTWFAMARARRGILGMGPGAVVAPSESSFSMGQQVYPGLKVYNGDKLMQDMVGSAMKIIETQDNDGFYANFTLRGRDLGGVAYSGISVHDGGVVKRVRHEASSRGFLNAPNGETGAVMFNRGVYTVENMEVNGRDPKTGKRVVTSPIMVNSATGGSVENVYVHETFAGPGVTIWSSAGKHTFKDVRTEFASGINLENNKPGFEFEWDGGTDYIDYQHKGEWPNIPDANFKNNSGLHVNMRSPQASQKVTIRNVAIDKGPQPGSLSVQVYAANTGEAKLQRAEDVRYLDADGTSLPVKTYGTINVGA